MESKLKLQFNGQAVGTPELNILGESAALADDRVFAELFRMAPFGASVAKGVLCLGAPVVADGATGSVLVNPLRALIGSRTLEATDAKQNFRDIRSTLSVGATSLTQAIALAANSSGNPRWDLVYAVVTLEVLVAPGTRKVKDTVTSAVTSQSVSPIVGPTVSLAVLAGTPGASPAFPAIPGDSDPVYYVPLAYVRVPDGFGAGSTVANKDINGVAPILSMSRAMGVSSLRPANQQNKTGGTAIIGAGTTSRNGPNSWTGAAGTRPAAYIPPSMVGSESVLIAIDLGNASSANWSHQDGDIVDDSIDWRNRIFRWNALVGAGGGGQDFPWVAAPGNGMGPIWTNAFSPMPGFQSSLNQGSFASGMGRSGANGSAWAVAAVSASGPATTTTPAAGHNIATETGMTGGGVALYVDASTGALKVSIAGAPGCTVIFWLDATAPYPNV